MGVTQYNKLTKQSLITFLPGQAGTPGNPGQPALPARCVNSWVTTQVQTSPVLPQAQARFVPLSQIQVQNAGIPIPSTWQAVYGPDPTNPNNTILLGYVIPSAPWPNPLPTYRTVTVLQTICYPAQPYIAPTNPIPNTPAKTIINMQLGWSGGAIGIPRLTSEGRMEFMVPTAISGAFVGLNDADVDAGYMNMEYSWYFNQGVAKVYELGFPKFTYGPYQLDDLFAIQRIGRTITYTVNGVVVYKSTTPSYTESIFDVSLFAAGDYIYNPAIYAYNGANISFDPLASIGADSDYGSSIVQFQELTALGEEGVAVHVSMRQINGLSYDYDYNFASSSLSELLVSSSGGMLIGGYGLCSSAMSPIVSGSLGDATVLGTVSAQMREMEGLSADYDYAAGVTKIYPLTSYGEAMAENEATIAENMFLYSPMYYPDYKIAIFDSKLTLLATIGFDTLLMGEILGNLALSQTFDPIAFLYAVINNVLIIGQRDQKFEGAEEVWVVSEEGQTTRYENFGFNSFAKIGGSYYGAKSDGVYLLEGDDDYGSPVRSSIGFGNNNFGTSLRKRLLNAYLNVASKGKMAMNVSSDGDNFTYEARRSDTEMTVQRVDFGKGLNANNYTLSVMNIEGCDFDLADVEILPAVSTRRI